MQDAVIASLNAVREILSASRSESDPTMIEIVPSGEANEARIGWEIEADARSEGATLFEPSEDFAVFQHSRSETEFLYREIIIENLYFRNGISIPDGANIIDLGANIGMFSVAAALRTENAHIFAVEPIKELTRCADYNGRLHAIDLTIKNCAVGLTAGTAEFTYYPNNSVMSKLSAIDNTDVYDLSAYIGGIDAEGDADVKAFVENRLTATPRQVDVVTVNDIIRESGFERIDILKVDIEGHELEIVKSIDFELRPRICQMLIEVKIGTDQERELRERLTEWGYEVASEYDQQILRSGFVVLYAQRPDHPRAAEKARRSVSTRRSVIAKAHNRLLADGIDTTDLKEIIFQRIGERAERQSRSAEAETALRAVWVELLGTEPGADDANFFECGGNSLRAIKLMSRIRNEFGEDAISPAVIFDTPTFGAYVAAVSRAHELVH